MQINIPKGKFEQFRLYRSLVNIRPASEISEEYINSENEFLKNEIFGKGITDSADLKPVEDNIFLWQGDITTLKCGAIVNAANSGMTGCYIPCHACIDNCKCGFYKRIFQITDVYRQKNQPLHFK